MHIQLSDDDKLQAEAVVFNGCQWLALTATNLRITVFFPNQTTLASIQALAEQFNHCMKESS